MSDFKAPDVVYTDKASLVLANAKGYTNLGLIVTNSATARLFSYTLTTTAEANTREKVREVLGKVKAALDGDELFDAERAWTKVNQLLKEYQEPPTEASDE